MHSLDDSAEIKKIDKGNILGSIVALPQQVEEAWREIKQLKLPDSYGQAKNIVVSGMGGSALGGRIVDSLILDKLRTPFEVFTGFRLPKYVNEHTLAILSSYSGSTEETLASARDAIDKKAQVVGIGTGGKLEELFRSQNLPFYKISPAANPSNQPRMGLGYSISATLAILSRLEFTNLSDNEMTAIIRIMGECLSDYGVESPFHRNLAKALALKIKGKVPVLIASEHLLGSVHAFKNQLNENAKTFSMLFDLPEANHHLMEGLKNPATIAEQLLFIFFESSLYPAAISKRYPITREVVEKNGVAVTTFKLRSEKKVEQIFELLVFGSFVSLYLAILYGGDPSPIPWVDYFKKQLTNAK